jgi:hypothetical protein
MVRKKVSSEIADPTINHGWQYFCEVTKYNNHLAKYGEQPEQVSKFALPCDAFKGI